MAQVFINDFLVNLAEDISATDLSFDLTDASDLPALSGDFIILRLYRRVRDAEFRIEYIKVTAVSGNTITCTRGYNSSTAHEYAKGSFVTNFTDASWQTLMEAKVSNATHTGDVTGDTALTIGNDKVTYAKMQNVVADERILGRISGADGDVEELTVAQVLTMLGLEDLNMWNLENLPLFMADVVDLVMLNITGAEKDSDDTDFFDQATAHSTSCVDDTWEVLCNLSGKRGFFVNAVGPASILASVTHSIRITIDGVAKTYTNITSDITEKRLAVGAFISENAIDVSTEGDVQELGAKVYMISPIKALGGFPILFFTASLKVEVYCSNLDTGSINDYACTNYMITGDE